MGTESHGENVSAGDGQRFVAELGQLCYLLGKNGNSAQAPLLSSIPQVSLEFRICGSGSIYFMKTVDLIICFCYFRLVRACNRGWSKIQAVQHVDWDWACKIQPICMPTLNALSTTRKPILEQITISSTLTVRFLHDTNNSNVFLCVHVNNIHYLNRQ